MGFVSCGICALCGLVLVCVCCGCLRFARGLLNAWVLLWVGGRFALVGLLL